jgi:predicted Fe-Mo cluster-binding NifX family protein
MKRCTVIAIPNCQGRVSPVLDVAARFTVVRLEGGTEVGREEVVLFENEPKEVVRTFSSRAIDLLICGALSRELYKMLQQAHVRLIPQICGELDAVLQAFRDGKLGSAQFHLPGTSSRTPRGVSGLRRARGSHKSPGMPKKIIRRTHSRSAKAARPTRPFPPLEC